MHLYKKYKIVSLSLGLVVILAAVVFMIWPSDSHKNSAASISSKTNSIKKSNSTQIGFNKSQNSLITPASIWVIVNKQHPLAPKNYVPADLTVPNVPLRVPGNESMQLRKAAATGLEQMFNDAKSGGINLMLSSGYRSYTYQVGLYGGYVQSQGQAAADQESARPGYSEHQTGMAADIEPVSKNCELEQCFENTPEGLWLKANAYKYGFILRYTSDKVAVTGYEYEPWHYRYVGIDLAKQMRDTSTETLEEFFGISGGPNY